MPATHRISGLVFTEHELELPLDHGNPSGEKITVFARVVEADDDRERPYLVFFQGGPGSEAPRPVPPAEGWHKRALEDYRLVLLDQRGTGRSTPVGALPGRSA